MITRLYEMAKPTSKHLNKKYYHGTSTELSGQGIIKNGILPPDLKNIKGKLKPIQGNVYLTSNLKYAIIYAIGANMLGVKLNKKYIDKSKYGYLFVIDGKSLVNIQPDEDSVGEMIYNLLNDEYMHDYNLDEVYFLKNLAEYYLTDKQFIDVKEYNDYGDLAVAGKKLIKYMNDEQKLACIDAGAHIGHVGKIIPTEAWKFDKTLCEKLNKNGLNFFKLAIRIK